ncbi:MAG: cell division protein FtsZ [Rhodobacteraceae bacterium]|nr:cell division protein FtsZ [Paracoccaceae bacterium]
MALNLRIPEHTELKPKITVFGVGGAGGNAVNNMIEKELDGVEFIIANTDAQALHQGSADNKIQMGLGVTQGLGSGARPEVGAAAAEEAIEQIVDKLTGVHMCFITAGMGGGTGTGAAPVIAQTARELGVLTVGVVTKPFQFEGAKRMRQAEDGIKELQKVVDTLIIIPNQNLFRLANENTTFTEAFSMADDVLYQGVKGVTDLMVRPGLINLDFADVRAIMDEMGKAMMGTGEAEGEERALKAAEKAIANPLLDEISLSGAKGVLINITGGNDLTLFELDEAANRIREEVDPNANIIVGSTLDTSLEGKMRVSVVATGIDASNNEVEKPYKNDEKVVQLNGLTDAVNINDMSDDEPLLFDTLEIKDIRNSEDEARVLVEEKSIQYDEKNDLDNQVFDSYQVSDDKVDNDDSYIAALSGGDEKPAPAIAKKRFGINSLIGRMTNGSGNTNIEDNLDDRKEPILSGENDDTEFNDDERIEVPAFLRRQAN